MPPSEPGDDDQDGLALPAEAASGFQLPDLQGLLAQAQQVQEQLLAAQADGAATSVDAA